MAAGTWGVSLEGVYLSGGSDPSNNLTDDCPDQIIAGCLTAPPQGLGLPGRRTEDVTFSQRHGVKHYSDWFEPRQITLEKVVICDDGCGSTGAARQKVRDLVKAWSTACCDTELVVYTPGNGTYYDSVLFPQLEETRTNLFAYNSLGQAFTNNCGTFEFTTSQGFGSGTGTYSNYAESVDLPAGIVAPQQVARKTWITSSQAFCRDYTESGGTKRCYSTISGAVTGFKYDVVSTGSNEGTGFLMGCVGQGGYTVNPDETYTFSGYMRSNVSNVNFLIRVNFYDADGVFLSSEDGTVVASIADTWVRIDHTATVPTNAVTMQFLMDLGDGGPTLGVGDHVDATAVLVEKSDVLGSYFDGAFLDSDDRVLGGQKIVYEFTGDRYGSPSVYSLYTYVPGRDHGLDGPYGIVGRPRVAEVTWQNNGVPCATVLLRFDAVDHLMYVLDDCGTPGYSNCISLEPGSTILCRPAARCYTDEENDFAYCYSASEQSISVVPTTINVEGTEDVSPTITLNGPLTYPRIEDIVSTKAISFQGTLEAGDAPVVIYTNDGTAIQNGVSVSHLIGGDVDFSLEAGSHDLRMVTQSSDDSGDASICWRAAVISA